MLLMDPLSEVHVFITRVKMEKLYWGGGQTNEEKDKTMSSEKYWRTPVFYVVANIPGNGMPVRSAILNFFVKFRKPAEHLFSGAF